MLHARTSQSLFPLDLSLGGQLIILGYGIFHTKFWPLHFSGFVEGLVQGKGKRRQRRCLYLFTCLATRAVHLKIAFAVDTDSFLNAFYRMVSRCEKPEEVGFDNGGNFVAADKELQIVVSNGISTLLCHLILEELVKL